MLKKVLTLTILLLIASCASQETTNTQVINYYQAETKKPYDDVLAELEIAIAEHNFRITGHSRVGKVIRERGAKDFPDFDTIQFCNLSYAKTFLLMSPHGVSYMPCSVVVYQFEESTIVKTHLLPTHTENPKLNAFSEKMNFILKQIVDFSVEE